MLIWTLVFEKVVSLTELETTWNLDDAYRAYAVLEIKNEMMNNQIKKNKRNNDSS